MKVPFFCKLLPVLALLALTGCSTAYYENRAVERAREYLLKNSPELTAEQQAFVRYNRPVLLEESIFADQASATSDMSQICITWVIPGQKDAYLVFGASDTRLQSWYPNRLIRKTFRRTNKLALAAAIAQARKYAQNGLYYDLSNHEYNSVRFEQPAVCRTNFVLPAPDIEDPAKLEARKKLVQYSMVWSPRGQENKVVVYGLAAPDLKQFTAMGGGVMRPAYLQRHTLPDKPAPAAAAPQKEQAK